MPAMLTTSPRAVVRMVVGLSESSLSDTPDITTSITRNTDVGSNDEHAQQQDGGIEAPRSKMLTTTEPYSYQHDMNMAEMVIQIERKQQQQQQRQQALDDHCLDNGVAVSLMLPKKDRQESDATAATVPSVTSTSTEHLMMDGDTEQVDSSLSSSDLLAVEDVEEQQQRRRRDGNRSNVVKEGDDSNTLDIDDDDQTFSDSGIYSVGKLYGRTKEQKTLHDLYNYIVEHGKYNQQQQQQQGQRHPLREFVLLSGGVGTGKSSLAETLRRRVVVDDGGYFCTGIFDQMMQRGPMAPMVDAFDEFVTQVFDKGDEEVAIIQKRIRCMVDADDLPALEGILPSLTDLLSVKTEHRMTLTSNCGCSEVKECMQSINNRVDNRAYSHRAMIKLMRAISRPERPVVLFLDDLQWAGACAFDFLRPMTMDDMNDGFMYLGTTRDNVSPDSDVSNFLRHIEDGAVHITNINLGHLSLDSVEEMVNDTFLMPPEQSSSFAKFMHMNSSGNPFFISMSIRTIQREPRLVAYDKETNEWSMNNEVADQYVSHCPIHLIMKKLETFPRDQQKVLSVASCLGSHATQTMIETALQEDAAEPLRLLVAKRKLVFDEKERTYTIRHNAIQEAAQGLVGQDLLPAYRLEIGLRLMRNLSPEDLDDNIFCLVSQLKTGMHLLKDQSTKYEVAAIFVRMAEKAAVTFSFEASHLALQVAYDLLGPNHWEEAYDLTLLVYNYLAEVEFAVKDNERVDRLLDDIFEKSKMCSDMVRAYTTKVHVLGVRGESTKAITIGMCILKKLGIKMPKNPSKRNLFWTLRNVEGKLKGRSNESLKRTPLMTDGKLLVGMQVLNLLFLNTFHHNVELFPFVVLKMMKLSLKHGFSAMTSVAFGGYGTLLCLMQREQEAQRFGRLALDLADQFNAASYRSRVFALYYGCIQASVRPWKDSLDFLKEGHRLGLNSGDIEFGMYNANLHFAFMLDDGSFNVLDVANFLKDTLELTELHGHDHQLMMMKVCSESLFAFSDPNHDLHDHSSIDAALNDVIRQGNIFTIGMMYCFKASAYMITGELQKGLESLDKRRSICAFVSGSIFENFEHYLDGLFAFGLARRETNSSMRQKLIQRGKKDMHVLQRLAMINPETCGGKALLLEAEYAALTKKEMVANQKYSQAIAIGAGHGAHFEVAVASQVAADHFLFDLDDLINGEIRLEQALIAYERWGAFAFATAIRKRIQDIKKRSEIFTSPPKHVNIG